jgi:hypothetical protein
VLLSHNLNGVLLGRESRPGSTLPVVVVLLVVVVGMVAFAVDVGYVAHARTELQATADSGALAGLANLYSNASASQDFTTARAEVRKYVGGSAANIPNFIINDADIQFGYFNQNGTVGSRFTTTLGVNQANALRVILRKDGTTNAKLNLFFAPILGKSDNAVQAQATTWIAPGLGIKANAELIPYVAQVDYFNAAAGLPTRPTDSTGFVSVNNNSFLDQWRVGAPGTTPALGQDGLKELLLFSGDQTTPGNFGSLDLGSASNGTPELARQLRNGPTSADFAILQSGGKLAADGSLQGPVSLGGDTGISNGTKDDWAAIIGLNRIIPLYDTVSGNGNNTSYHIVGFAGVRIVAADLQGNPKRVWVQPTSFYSSKVTALPSGATGDTIGVYAPPRLVIP